MKKYLFLPGGLMVVAALAWAAMTLRWDTTAIVLAAGGLLALAVAVAANWQSVSDWFRDPRGIFVLNSILTTILLVAVLGLVNAIASLRAAQLDMTAAGRNTLTDETREGLDRLQQDVELKQFGRARDSAIDQLLAAFANETRRVRVGYSDPELAPQEARTYGVMRDGTVIVSGGAKWRKVEKATEPALFQAIAQVTMDREPVVCFSTGQGERGVDDQGAAGLSHLASAVAAAGYKAERIALQQAPVPRSCEVLVVPGPSAGLSPEALSHVSDYLGDGGRLALMIDPPVDAALKAWLEPRGITTGDGYIIETNPASKQVGAGPESPLALKYFNHPIAAGFELATIYHRAIPLGLQRQAQIGLPEPLAGTGDRAFERVDLTVLGAEFREGRDRPGPFLLAIASIFPRGLRDDKTVQEGRMVVFGDSDFLTNAFVNRQGNRDLALRVIAWLAGEREARVVSLSDRQNRRTSMTEQMKTVMYVVNLGVLPLLPLIAGLVQFIRSRK
jgi:ABC-type uncharacterized transport system involved in gliding motility auxiliary subunit